MTPALVVSLHDVSPRTHAACARIVDELRALGVKTVSLLVIPNHHGRGHFLDDAGFCDWLRARAGDGHEIVIHGYTHRRARRPNEGIAAMLTTRIYTADEGEFFDLDRKQAAQLVEKAREEFRRAHLEPRGFIAPAWLISADAERALIEFGIEYTTRLREVADLQRGAIHPSQSLVWSVRAAWRRTASLGWNAMLFRALAANPVMRISIHPVDIEHPAIWRQIRDCVVRGLSRREPFTYLAWLERQRQSRDQNPAP